ncbi:MAG: penicillin-insensitive murein endopeptidase [Myxococcota bacterium]
MRTKTRWIILAATIFFSMLALSVPVKVVLAATKLVTITHKLKKGETLGEVAQKYDVSVKQLKRWNKIKNPRSIRPGQRLKIAVPASSKHARSAKKKRRHARRKRKGRRSRSKKSSSAQRDPSIDVKALPKPKPLETAGLVKTPGFVPERMVAPVEVVTNKDGEKIKIATYEVLEGETLGLVALKLRVSVRKLQRWNGLGKRTLTVKPGTTLIVKSEAKPPPPKGPVPATYRVKRGDSLIKISRKLKVDAKKLKKWNRKLKPNKLRVGQSVRYYTWPKDGATRSVGTPQRGRLVNGVSMKSTPWLKVRDSSNAYGMPRVINMLDAVAADALARWPDSERLVVGDLSFKHGGRMKRHKSHQSGRDADLTFYHKGNVELSNFHDMTRDSIDAVKTWHIFKLLIDTGEVEYIFVDYPLQRELYEYAKSIGYNDAELGSILQYPRSKSSNFGIVRHTPGHDDHFHIRFKCSPGDQRCR